MQISLGIKVDERILKVKEVDNAYFYLMAKGERIYSRVAPKT